MSPQIDHHAWAEGFKDAYAGLPARQETHIDLYSYGAGQSDGEALREKHLAEVEWMLGEGLRRLAPGQET